MHFMENNLRLDAKGWGMLLLLSILWGGSFLFVEIGLEELPPVSIVAFRVTFAAIAAIILLKVTSQPFPRDFSLWRSFLLMGLVNNVMPFMLIVWGQQYVLGGVAAILNASTPVFAVLVAQVFTSDEKLTLEKTVGLIVAIIGVVIVIGLDVVANFSMNNLGQFAILAAGISYAVASVFGRRFGKAGIAPLTVTTGQLTIATLVLVPLAFWFDGDLLQRSMSLRVVWAMIGLAIVSTTLAYLLYFKLIATAGATNATLVTILVPVSAIVLTWALLGEQLPSSALEGMLVIAAGLLILDGRILQWGRAIFL